MPSPLATPGDPRPVGLPRAQMAALVAQRVLAVMGLAAQRRQMAAMAPVATAPAAPAPAAAAATPLATPEVGIPRAERPRSARQLAVSVLAPQPRVVVTQRPEPRTV